MTPVLGSRELFPDLHDRVFLAHAAVSPPSRRVLASAQAFLSAVAAGGPAASVPAVEQRGRVRALLGRLLGTSGENFALTAGTTWGVLAVAQSYPWRDGDRILCLEGEFPTNVIPWTRLGLEVRWLPAESFRTDEGMERLQDELRRGLRMVAVSAVQFQSGLRMPLQSIGELCHAHGAELFVDAIQAAGVVPLELDKLPIDYLAGGSHKWLMGLEGCGYLYVHPDRLSGLRRKWVSWLSLEDPLSFLFEEGKLRYDRAVRDSIRFLEAGSTNAVGFAALEAALETLLELGVENIYRHVQRCHDVLEPLWLEAGHTSLRPTEEARSGILSFRPRSGQTAAELAAALLERGVRVSYPDGLVRIAPHWPNSPSDLSQAVPG